MNTGLILLCALGNLHVSWTIWQLLLYVFDYQNTETDVLIAWFVGAAGGGIFGAILNASWSKILIYVSILLTWINTNNKKKKENTQKRKELCFHFHT